ncbi:hypothetical protein GH714_002420 [Hevea brasiliensis]|uniref:Uncharacterized protein n=1 Tax=Hevea brasiliensis TaxID=3981 RepID=A0A6A6KHD7_HEVBR|nr:hypothetical protein GH714_002420 [Hevea brasiliensis]
MCSLTHHLQLTAAAAKFTKVSGAAEEAGNDTSGENAESGPGAVNSSGLGGLWVEGMVGKDDTVGEGNTPPGEGRRGAISGDNSWKGDRGGEFCRDAGEVGIVESCELSGVDEERNGKMIKDKMNDKRNQKEAILMMKEINAILNGESKI